LLFKLILKKIFSFKGDINGFNKIPRKSIKREGKKFDFPLPEEIEEKVYLAI